jgi:uncharacterized protein YkwD
VRAAALAAALGAALAAAVLALHAAAQAVPARAAAPTDVSGCDGARVVLTAEEARTVALHERQRAADGLPRFCVHPALVAAARAHAADMIVRGYFGHAAPEGVTVDGRVRRAGYRRWRIVAENLGWGNGSLRHPEPIFSRWMTSPGHRANIRSPALREIGVGVAHGTVRGSGTVREFPRARMYVVTFGTRRPPAPTAPPGKAGPRGARSGVARSGPAE